MEEELKRILDEIVESTCIAADVQRAAEATIEQMKKTVDPKFNISDPKDIIFVVNLYNAAKKYYSGDS